MVEESQGQGGLDGEIRVAPLPAPPAAPAGRPGSDRFRGHPHRHIAAANEGLIIGRPVRNAVLRLIRGMNLRLHPCSVTPAVGPEKCGPRRPTRAGPSCNNAADRRRVMQDPVENRAGDHPVAGRSIRMNFSHRLLGAPLSAQGQCSHVGILAGISVLSAPDGPLLHPKAAAPTRIFFIAPSSRF